MRFGFQMGVEVIQFHGGADSPLVNEAFAHGDQKGPTTGRSHAVGISDIPGGNCGNAPRRADRTPYCSEMTRTQNQGQTNLGASLVSLLRKIG